MIKLITDRKHRFNKYILIGDKNVFIDSKGEIQVDENDVVAALDSGFELVDKDVRFTSKEEAKKVKEVTDILNSAKEQAKEIIAEAEREAKNIIMEAQKQANVIITESNVEEKDEFLKKIQDMKVDELREIVASSDVFTPEQYKGMKKAELIDAIMKIKYSQE